MHNHCRWRYFFVSGNGDEFTVLILAPAPDSAVMKKFLVSLYKCFFASKNCLSIVLPLFVTWQKSQCIMICLKAVWQLREITFTEFLLCRHLWVHPPVPAAYLHDVRNPDIWRINCINGYSQIFQKTIIQFVYSGFWTKIKPLSCTKHWIRCINSLLSSSLFAEFDCGAVFNRRRQNFHSSLIFDKKRKHGNRCNIIFCQFRLF